MYAYLFRCFGARPGSGNPALVIENGRADPAARQAFARDRNTTCVWIDPAREDSVAAVVDFYYPHTRSPLCLHATLAVAHLLFTRAGTAGLAVRTAMHGQELGLVHSGDALFVRLAPQAVAQPPVTRGQVAGLLRIPEAVIGAPPRVASVGSPKLLVEVTDAATLHQLAPDLAAIAHWSKGQDVNGLYVYCRLDDGTVEGRNFNHLDPALEDSATGVAAGALSVLLGQGLSVRQGRATGRDCLIHTRFAHGAVLVGGHVEACQQAASTGVAEKQNQ